MGSPGKLSRGLFHRVARDLDDVPVAQVDDPVRPIEQTRVVEPAAVPLLWFGHHLVKTMTGAPGGALSDRLPRGLKPQMGPISSVMGQIMILGMWSEGDKTDSLEIRTQDAFTAIPQLAAAGRHFDLILADPPYGEKNVGRRSTSLAQQLLDQLRIGLAARRPHHLAHQKAQRRLLAGSELGYCIGIAGDDLRHLDWNAYGRLDELLIKTFRAEREAPMHIFIDASASMAVPADDGKFAFALGLALVGSPLLAKVRALLRREHAFPRDPRKKFGVAAVFSTEPLRYPDPQASCEVPSGPAGLNCAGFGSSVCVTSVFGMAAAAHAINQVVGK